MPATPGVFIEEQNAFPGSVVAVETSVPIFIGYTEKAEKKGKSVTGDPVRINSFAEYTELFGYGFTHKFSLNIPLSKTAFAPGMLVAPAQIFYLFNSMRLFYANGGGACYIMSVGNYGTNEKLEIKKADFINDGVWETLEKEFEPTLVVIPDMVNHPVDCYEVYNKVLLHCQKMQNRFAIFDVIPDGKEIDNSDAISNFRAAINNDALNYGAAYYPWLKTVVVNDAEINFKNLTIEKMELHHILAVAEANTILLAIEQDDEKRKTVADKDDKTFHQYLATSSAMYKQIIQAVKEQLNLLPPAAAMAGIYTMVDSQRGVWKAPANVSLSVVTAPSINITHEQQEWMNVDVTGGKSINAIRPFPGIGTLVWGARTLDGNSLDWKYINVRRTMIMIEQSIKLACRAYIFEPNDAGTWITIKSMINNFLTNLWKQGGLAGAVPQDAFDVQIGLGSTMTPNDILDGILAVSVKLAIVRPAEFIVITFQQQQQKA